VTTSWDGDKKIQEKKKKKGLVGVVEVYQNFLQVP
jgi:hypothetical protein